MDLAQCRTHVPTSPNPWSFLTLGAELCLVVLGALGVGFRLPRTLVPHVPIYGERPKRLVIPLLSVLYNNMRRFLNNYEKVTYEKLRAVADNAGAHVFSKVRLADLLPINNSGIPHAEFSFALKAHVDFLVTNSQQEPQFCVEFDGPTHQQREQIERDEIKNSLFARFDMPYMRINARYLEDKYRGLDLLTYFVDVWFRSIAFDEAQEVGHIPFDEPFDPTLILSDGTQGGRNWPYWLSLDIQRKIKKLYERKSVAQFSPSHWIGADQRENLRCLAWLFVTDDECLFIETGMREHRFPAVDCSDVLSQLAVYDLYDDLVLALKGEKQLMSASDLEERLKYYQTRYKWRRSASCGKIKA